MSSEVVDEALRREWDLSLAQIVTLGEFNKHLCEMSEQTSAMISEFMSWFPELARVGITIADYFDLTPIKDEATGTDDFVDYCNATGDVVAKAVKHIISDKFTTGQLQQLRKMFLWFSEARKCIRACQPEIVARAGELRGREKQHEFCRKFSDTLSALADNVGAEAGDLARLNVVPSTFPYHAVAYSLLLCRLTESHERWMITECACKAQKDVFEVQRSCPSPRVLCMWPEFKKKVDQQNALIKAVAGQRAAVGEMVCDVTASQEEFGKARRAFEKVFREETELLQRASGLVNELGLVSARIRSLEFLKKHGNVDVDVSLPVFSDVNDDALGQDLERIVMEMEMVRKKLRLDDENLGDIISRRSVVRTPATARGKFDEIENIRMAAANNLTSLARFDADIDFIKAFPNEISCRETISKQTIAIPALMSLERTADSLKRKVEVKTEKRAKIMDEIYNRRMACDRAESVTGAIKCRMRNASTSCRFCEERRVFVLTRCGHTFCERCYNAIRDGCVLTCPHPGCNLSFSPEDVIRINWE